VNELFGVDQLIETGDFVKLVSRLGLNLFFVSIVVLGIYQRLYKNREYVFTYFLFNVITFAICVLLRKVPMELGFALGLFAVFGILRYRTEEIRMRDLTYLFIVLGIGILNAVANKKVSLAELLVVDVAIVGLTAVLELSSGGRGHGSTPMIYDNLALLVPDRHKELHEDLVKRTGLDVIRVRVNRIDMLRDCAEVTVYYRGAS